MVIRAHLWRLAFVAFFAGVTACDDNAPPADGGSPDADADADEESIDADEDTDEQDADSQDSDLDDPDPPRPPWDTLPCDEPRYWPRQVESSTHPLIVHYRLATEEDVAREVLQLLEISWEAEVDVLGFAAPLPDEGLCGPDERFDVFIWRGLEECYVDVLDVNPATDWNDWFAYLTLDPWGPYGGDLLDSTVAHELNHACQASDDWWESELILEATATFIEDVVFDDDDEYMDLLSDFQARPDWSLDYYDDYETWYMYGAALYLHFLRERHFDGDASFVAEMWRGCRNPHGDEYDPELNEPDFEDALDELLRAEVGIGFIDTVVEFARWRWYTASRDDGRHFEEGALFPEEALVASIGPIAVTPQRLEISPTPMMLGNAYVDLEGEPGVVVSFSLEIEDRPEALWVLQAVPGLDDESDGELIDLVDGSATVELDDEGRRTLVLTLVPSGENDPDTRSDRRYAVTLAIE